MIVIFRNNNQNSGADISCLAGDVAISPIPTEDGKADYLIYLYEPNSHRFALCFCELVPELEDHFRCGYVFIYLIKFTYVHTNIAMTIDSTYGTLKGAAFVFRER